MLIKSIYEFQTDSLESNPFFALKTKTDAHINAQVKSLDSSELGNVRGLNEFGLSIVLVN